MNMIQTIRELKSWVSNARNNKKSIGFVPTMGYLHEGHLSLIERARKENDLVVVSIFVNPLQFGPNEDFDSYPRDIQRDSEIAIKGGADLIFHPSAEEMYPNQPSVTVTVQKRVDALCGRSREGHFDGVATVVTKLFHLVGPDRVYFGMKDAQQVAVIEGLVQDLNFPVEIVPCETVRESDGLARSSRNIRLTEQERKQAPALNQALILGKELLSKGGSIEDTKTKMIKYLEQHTDGKIDYVEILSYPDLTLLEPSDQKGILAMAVQFSNARLIDNSLFDRKVSSNAKDRKEEKTCFVH